MFPGARPPCPVPGSILVTVDGTRRRRAGCHLAIEVHQPAELILQVAVAGAGWRDRAGGSGGGPRRQPVAPAEIVIPGEGRVHVLRAGPGRVTVDYLATVEGQAAPPEVTETGRLIHLRPSRYAESDRLAAIARAEFSGIATAADLLAAVSSWVGTQLSYVPGSSGPADGAVQTLLSRQGVCRDYAHLVIALLRALDVPARLAAV